MIIEGLITTINADASVNVSPMGPIVDPRDDDGERDGDLNRLVLRPYQTSTTYANLRRTGEGVFHVTDDVELLALAAVDRMEAPPAVEPAQAVDGWILRDACRWYAFRVRSLDDSEPRTRIEAEVVDRGWIRDFFGFNRAKHAVLEAAILATRLDHLPADEILADFARLAAPVEKTGGPRERRAFAFLEQFVQQALEVKSL